MWLCRYGYRHAHTMQCVTRPTCASVQEEQYFDTLMQNLNISRCNFMKVMLLPLHATTCVQSPRHAVLDVDALTNLQGEDFAALIDFLSRGNIQAAIAMDARTPAAAHKLDVKYGPQNVKIRMQLLSTFPPAHCLHIWNVLSKLVDVLMSHHLPGSNPFRVQL